MSTVRHISEIKPEAGKHSLSKQAIQGWLATLPNEATISGEVGMDGQRDPYPIFVGLRASWTVQVPDVPGASISSRTVYRP